MGHKGVSIRKVPKTKLKPLAIANHGGGSVSDLAQSQRGLKQLPGKTSGSPIGNGGITPAAGSKKPLKKH
jgi:hypothetical protein